jgi:hypothetical protein
MESPSESNQQSRVVLYTKNEVRMNKITSERILRGRGSKVFVKLLGFPSFKNLWVCRTDISRGLVFYSLKKVILRHIKVLMAVKKSCRPIPFHVRQ